MLEFIVAGAITLYAHIEKYKSVGIIGIRTPAFSGKISIVHSGGPADRAGIQAGDKIVKVIDEFGRHSITGEPGSEVTITLRRQVCSTTSMSCERCHEVEYYHKHKDEGHQVERIEEYTVTMERVPYQELNNKEVDEYFRGR